MIQALILLCLMSDTSCTPETAQIPVIIKVPQGTCTSSAEQAVALSYPEYRIVKVICSGK